MKAATMNFQYNLKSIMQSAREIRSNQSLTWSESLKAAWSEAKQKMAALKAALIAATQSTPEITIPTFKTTTSPSVEPSTQATPQLDRNHELQIFQITFNPAKNEDEYMRVHSAFFETLESIPTLKQKINWIHENLFTYFDTRETVQYIYHYIHEDAVYFTVALEYETVQRTHKVRIFKGFTYDYKSNIITYRQDQYQSLKGLLVELFVKAGIETSLKDWKKGVHDRTYIKSKTLDLGFWDNKTNQYTPGKEDLFLFLKTKLS